MTSFKLDENNNIIFNNSIVLVSGLEALKQDVKTLLLMFNGEYPFNLKLGINYYEVLRNNNKVELENVIIQRLLQDPRIKAVKNIKIFRNPDKSTGVTLDIVNYEGVVINV